MTTIPASERCNGCPKVRVDDTNHWHSLCVDGSDSLLVIRGIVKGRDVSHACGETCVHKLVSRWLATGKLEE